MIFIESRPIHPGPVRHEPRLQIPLFPEVIKGATLEIFKEEFVLAGNGRTRLPSRNRDGNSDVCLTAEETEE
ncbi:MAG: hypothetical protein LC776_14230 [Acidobacteria bacterium]|nr:hypothetical protein [Acidobacteriota bacterium]